jgi:hypothetical protein
MDSLTHDSFSMTFVGRCCKFLIYNQGQSIDLHLMNDKATKTGVRFYQQFRPKAGAFRHLVYV